MDDEVETVGRVAVVCQVTRFPCRICNALCLPLALKPDKDCDLDLLHVSKAVVSLAFPLASNLL
jgi:hypothetical protein